MFYYDILLNFNDYPINYYEWSNYDSIEKKDKIPVYKIEDIKKVISHHAKINCNDTEFILCDGINAVAVETINDKVAFLSYMNLEDEENICYMVRNKDNSDIEIKYGTKRKIPKELRLCEKEKQVFLQMLNENNQDLLEYVYYSVTNKYSKNVDKIKKYLFNDINNNFLDKYHELYEIIYK